MVPIQPVPNPNAQTRNAHLPAFGSYSWDFCLSWLRQVGYGTPYYSPQEMKQRGVSVVTLHQGIPGLVNGTLVNPYINWPFQPEVVEFLESYTSQAHALGLKVKYYYTIREVLFADPHLYHPSLVYM